MPIGRYRETILGRRPSQSWGDREFVHLIDCSLRYHFQLKWDYEQSQFRLTNNTLIRTEINGEQVPRGGSVSLTDHDVISSAVGLTESLQRGSIDKGPRQFKILFREFDIAGWRITVDTT